MPHHAIHMQVQKRLCVQDPSEPLEFYPVPLAERRLHGQKCVVISEDPLEPSSTVPDNLRLGDVILEIDSKPVKTLEVGKLVFFPNWRVCYFVTG